MTMIVWESHYELGIKSIDEQHKKLIEITSRLSELLTSAVEGDDIYDDMVLIISELTEYTVKHFGYEEKLFDKLNYVNKEAHKAEHKQLIDEIEKLDLRAVDEDQVTYGKKILKFLITWVFKHISGSDFLYRDMMIQNGIE
ncbi:MAG TPA: bacteriohemerythrin [Clostridiales bacterium UBA8960]|nr:bacteriohemerythrin [Clostridiales bacterium UBA8960]